MNQTKSEKIRLAALQRSEKNFQAINDRVRNTLESIMQDLDKKADNETMKQLKISIAEVARRSQIHPLTLHKERYRELYIEVKSLLEKINNKKTSSKNTKLDSTWKDLYLALLDSHRITEMDLHVANAKITELENKLAQRSPLFTLVKTEK